MYAISLSPVFYDYYMFPIGQTVGDVFKAAGVDILSLTGKFDIFLHLEYPLN